MTAIQTESAGRRTLTPPGASPAYSPTDERA